MINIPRILNCARVKLFTMLDGECQRPQRSAISVVPQQTAQLAICQAKGDRCLSLFFCDGNWKTLHTEYFDDIQTAIAHADQVYPGSHQRWMTPADAATKRHLADTDRRCSFCGETQLTPHNCVAGEDAYICYDCIQRYYLQTRQILHKKQAAS